MEIVTTLFEGNYEKGVGALVNSLIQSSFEGIVCIGYRGTVPEWTSQLTRNGNHYILSDTIMIRFFKLSTDMHFGYYKPTFMNEMIVAYPNVSKIYYFDPDIVVTCRWSFISSWAESGIGVCLDNCFPFVHYNHPWRRQWRHLAEDFISNDLSYYVNSGFIGIAIENKQIIERWIMLTQKYIASDGDVSQFEKEGSRAFKGDQDLLNAAMTISPDLPFSIIGLEGMAFTSPNYLMAHAVEAVKPWNNNFLKEVIMRGLKPTMAAKLFFNNCSSPIKIYSNNELFIRKLNLKTASLLGRIIGI
ncbi:glycosyltransferase family protein [Flavobacterium algicola]|uniref:hypothetical protein n=1 Tax=Flavobacterium algicola TaxID=556529 RepID=UPI001EFD038E|nr:hypothetical protein [Flavobacterium algicola]MCG9793515.1 hypothetical protein [Flavobacterium algicola]